MAKNTGILKSALCLLLLGTSVFAQGKQPSRSLYLKVGLDGGMTFIDPVDVNETIDDWMNFSGYYITGGTQKLFLDFNVAGYAGLVLADLFEFRPELEYVIAPKVIKVQGGSDLGMNVSSFNIGCSGLLCPNLEGVLRPLVGLGLFYHSASVNWETGLPQAKWKGNTLGFRIILGAEVRLTPSMGFSATAFYRIASIDELKTEQGLIVAAPGLGNFNLDLNGFGLKVGAFFVI